MEFETYADVIDAFERDNMGYETLTDYIRDQNIQIKEIDMNPLGDLKKTFAYGGIADNTKTYHQIHDYTAPPDLESVMGYANGGGVGSMMQSKKKNYKDQKLTAAQKKKIKPANQGGGPNYLGKEETVTVPKKWLSDPDHVVAELAYITPREQKILLDENLYGSLKGKPNKGPSGVMSLQGDLGGWSSGASGSSSGKGSGNANQGKGGQSNEDYKNTNYYKMMTGQLKKTSPLMHSTTAPGPKTKKYAVPEYVKVKQPGGGYKDKYIGSGYKSYGQPSFLGNLFSRGASGYRGIKGMPAFWGKPGFETRGVPGQKGFGYYSDKENFGETRDAVPFGIMGIISNMLNKFKKPKDMTESNKYGLGGSKNYIPAGTLDFDPNAKINQTIDTTGIDNSLALSNFYDPNAFNKNEKPKANITGADTSNIFKADTFDDTVGTRDPIRFNANTFDDQVGIRDPGMSIQNYMEGDAGMYSGLPNQKAVNEAAMDVIRDSLGIYNSNTFDDTVGTRATSSFDRDLFDDEVGTRASIMPDGPTGIRPDPMNDLFVSNNNIINSDLAPEFQNLVTKIGVNQKQKDLIDQAINNAQLSGTKIPAGIYDQAKNLDTEAESGFLGTDWGATEADPMTQQEYKDYLISQGYI